MTSLGSQTQPCNKCAKVEIFFSPDVTAPSGKLIPLDAQTGKPHDCEISNPFPCMWCQVIIYLDKKIVSESGKRIPLDFETQEPHNCPKRPRPGNRQLKYNKDRWGFVDV